MLQTSFATRIIQKVGTMLCTAQHATKGCMSQTHMSQRIHTQHLMQVVPGTEAEQCVRLPAAVDITP
jgi:hypothetical protein